VKRGGVIRGPKVNSTSASPSRHVFPLGTGKARGRAAGFNIYIRRAAALVADVRNPCKICRVDCMQPVRIKFYEEIPNYSETLG
jgi:hypothetical protein